MSIGITRALVGDHVDRAIKALERIAKALEEANRLNEPLSRR